MYDHVNKYAFVDRFRDMRPDQFSYEGLHALFDYLEDYEEDTGDSIQLDVIAICCDYCEYESIEEFNSDYDHDQEIKTLECIEEYTQVIPIPETTRFIIQQF